MTAQQKPSKATHWSTRTTSPTARTNRSLINRVWRASRLKPHLCRTFKVSNDPRFVEKLIDVVGLSTSIRLSMPWYCASTSQIQALDRTQKSLPIYPGRCKTMTHDYKRNGTTTLFAALDMLEGRLIAQCMPRHRHQEFIKFLNQIDAETPSQLDLHLIVDNYATHKHPKVKAWLKRHSRFHLPHFIPTSSSWLNLVERWFREITDKRIRRGVFRSVPQLIEAIQAYIDEHNDNPNPFVWTAKARYFGEGTPREGHPR